MKEFDFNLAKVLKVRSIREEMARLDYLQARQQADKLEDEVEGLITSQKRVYNHLREQGNIDPAQALRARKFLQHNRSEIESLQKELTRQQEVVDEKQEKLKERARRRQALEKLKENKAEEYYREMQKETQKRIDDIAQHRLEEDADGILSG